MRRRRGGDGHQYNRPSGGLVVTDSRRIQADIAVSLSSGSRVAVVTITARTLRWGDGNAAGPVLLPGNVVVVERDINHSHNPAHCRDGNRDGYQPFSQSGSPGKRVYPQRHPQ